MDYEAKEVGHDQASFIGTIDVRIDAVYRDGWFRKDVPQMVLDMSQSDEFIREIFTVTSGNYFDQPPAARALIGTITTVNKLTSQEAGSAYINVTPNRFDFFMNCNDKEVEKALDVTTAPDSMKLAGLRSIMNALVPPQLEIDWQLVLGIAFSINPQTILAIEDYELKKKEGAARLLFSEDKFLEMEGVEKLKTPAIKQLPNGHVQFSHTIFLEYEDSTNSKVHDFAVIPIEVYLTTNLTFSEIDDPTQFQTVSGHVVDIDFKFKPCHQIQNFAIDEAKFRNLDLTDEDIAVSQDGGEDEDDFEESGDDEKDEKQDAKAVKKDPKKDKYRRSARKLSSQQQLFCSAPALLEGAFRGKAPTRTGKTNKIESILLADELVQGYLDLINGYNMTNEAAPSFGLGCLGLDILGPRSAFKKNKVEMEVKMNPNPSDFDPTQKYCDDPLGEQYLSNPYWLEKNRPEWFQRFKEGMVQALPLDFEFWFQFPSLNEHWFGKESLSRKHQISPMIHQTSSHYFLKEFCLERLPEADPAQCAMNLGFLRPLKYYDKYLTEEQLNEAPYELGWTKVDTKAATEESAQSTSEETKK